MDEPIDVTTTPKLDSGSWTKEGHHKAGEINEQHEEGFANVGLVPSTSNIMFGFRGLEEGKVSVKLQGYLITSYPYVDEYNTVLDEECRIIEIQYGEETIEEDIERLSYYKE